MFGIMFKTSRGELEMAVRKLFTDRTVAEGALKELVAFFGPQLAARYTIVEITFEGEV